MDVLTATRGSFWPEGTPRWVMGWLAMGNGDTPDMGRGNEDTDVCSCPIGVDWLKVTGNECEAFVGVDRFCTDIIEAFLGGPT